MIQQAIQELSESEIAELDMRAVAELILERTVTLSAVVNKEIIKPISEWLDDPEFLKKYEIILEQKIDWAAYKRNQREWTRQQRQIAAQRLRLYWQEIRRKRHLKKEMSMILNKNRTPPDIHDKSIVENGKDLLTPALFPFSPKEHKRFDTLRQLEQSRTIPLSNRLPWEAMLSSDIGTPIEFEDLPLYIKENQILDTVAKLQNLLQLETVQKIRLTQNEPFGRIKLIPEGLNRSPKDSWFTILDASGTSNEFDWKNLNIKQRKKIIDDIKDGEIFTIFS